jgi:EmrB/QacA subfamily drug resistance transporter
MVESTATPYATLSRRALFLAVGGLMLTLLLAALDQTIVGTAMPRVIAELRGFEHYAWVTTAYLLTSTAVVPIVGKLTDLYGRKRFLLGGVVAFLVASALCGLSQDMLQLIVFRGVQGVGGGVLMATVFAGVSALFPPRERARYQGLFGAIFGLASVIGPLIGGYLTDYLSWRWVFYVNLPVGLIALSVLWMYFPDLHQRRAQRPLIDYAGSATLVAGVVPLLLALSWGGREYAWSSPLILGLLTFAVAMTGLFLFIETRAPEPIIPLRLFRINAIAVSCFGLAVMAAAMFGTVLFIPLFLQGVVGSTAAQSGSVLAPMMIAMVTTSTLAGQLIARTGRTKPFGILGLAIAAVGFFLLSAMGPETDYLTVVRNMIIIGIGLGPSMPTFTLAAQNAVPFSELGVVTSVTQFARSMGGTLGAAAFGGLMASRFGPALQRALPTDLGAAMSSDRLAQLADPQALLSPQALAAMRESLRQLVPGNAEASAALVTALRVALANSLHEVFFAAACLATLAVFFTLLMKEVPLRAHNVGREAAAPPAETPAAPGAELAARGR